MSRILFRKLILFLAIVVTITLVVVIRFWGAEFGPSLLIEHMAPGFICDNSWRRSIASDPTAHGYSAYGVLQERKSRAAITEATRDLQSSDPYVWFNAALYLGDLGVPSAVPYLIKGLRHPAYRSHSEVAALLQTLTGQSFGTDFQAWKTWWESQNSNDSFNFKIET